VKRPGVVFPALVVAVSALVALVGIATVRPEWRTGVAVGTGIGCVFQLLSFWAMLALFPGQQLLAFGLGMLGRFALVALAALVMLPLTGLPATPTLLALVSVLFATTLLEPLFLRPTHGTSR